MVKKISIGLLVSILAVPLIPTTGMSWHGGGPRSSFHGRYGGHYHYGRHHRSGAWLWGLGGLILGSAVVAAAMQPPAVAYPYSYSSYPYSPYAYQPRVAPGACRWERYVLDGYGRTMLDRYGQPIKEYTTGPCDYPPPR